MTVTPGFVYREGEEDSFPEVTVPVIARPSSDGQVKPKVPTEEALKVLDKEPIPTVWKWSTGRPIYDRLPAVAGTYKQEYRAVYERDGQDQAYVYLAPPFQTAIGPGSLEPSKRLDNFNVLEFENGQITWSAGTLKVDSFSIDTSVLNGGLGLQDGAYQAGYLLSETTPDSPSYAKIAVENSLLGEARVAFAASGEFLGHPASAALSGPDLPGSWWPREFSNAGDYTNASWFVLNLQDQPKSTAIKLEGDPNLEVSANCGLYSSDDAIVWYKQSQQAPANNQYNFSLNNQEVPYWKFLFWGKDARTNAALKANIETIRYTGDLFVPNYKSITPSPFAEPFIDDLYEEIKQEHLLVCTFNVVGGVIQGLQDQRQFIYRDYQPVAEWLTTFQDTQLKCLFDDVEKYSTKFMAPPTADFSYYDELDDSLCFGRGFLTVGNIQEQLTIDFPTKVLLDVAGGLTTITEGDLLSDPKPGDFIQTDEVVPEELETDGSNVVKAGGITPSQIWELADPTTDGSAANAGYVDFTLNLSWSIDNGIY